MAHGNTKTFWWVFAWAFGVAMACSGFMLAPNYARHVALEYFSIEHPQFVPSASSVRLVNAGFTHASADLFWLKLVQYIGSYASTGYYRAYMAALVTLITDLSPDFTEPYVLTLLILPNTSEVDAEHTADDQKHAEEARIVGEQGIRNTCDATKVQAIRAELNPLAVVQNPLWQNPCPDWRVPYYLAFLYHWYLNNPQAAASYYRVASAIQGAPKGSTNLAALLEGQGGNRMRSAAAFLAIAAQAGQRETNQSAMNNAGRACLDGITEYTTRIRSESSDTFPSETFLVALSTFLDTVRRSEPSSVYTTDITYPEGLCRDGVTKALREANLATLERADRTYKTRTGTGAAHAQDLLGAKLIPFIPRDPAIFADNSSLQYVPVGTTSPGRWKAEHTKQPHTPLPQNTYGKATK